MEGRELMFGVGSFPLKGQFAGSMSGGHKHQRQTFLVIHDFLKFITKGLVHVLAHHQAPFQLGKPIGGVNQLNSPARV